MSNMLRTMRRNLSESPAPVAQSKGRPTPLVKGFRDSTVRAKLSARVARLAASNRAAVAAPPAPVSKPSLFSRVASAVRRVFRSTKGR